MSANKLMPSKVVKQELDCLKVYPADGGYIVKKEFKYCECGLNEKRESEPDPVVFGEGDVAKMLAYIQSELGGSEGEDE
jgi:hypothetical protein